MERFIVKRAREDEPELKQPPYAGIVPKVHFRWILSGPSKSGKTNLARFSLDKFYQQGQKKSWFDRIYLLSPTANIDWNWADLPGLKPKDRISRPTPKHLKKILAEQMKHISGTTSERASKNVNLKALSRRKQTSPQVLVIFDDAIAESKLINSPEFLKLFIQGRHYNISSMVMTQSYVRVPRSVRLQATNISMFPSRSTEIDRLYTEHGPRQLSKRDFTEMVQFATQPTENDQYPFLYVDCFAPVKTRFRRNFTQTLEIATEQASSPTKKRKRKMTG
jgi:hypothetical protein